MEAKLTLIEVNKPVTRSRLAQASDGYFLFLFFFSVSFSVNVTVTLASVVRTKQFLLLSTVYAAIFHIEDEGMLSLLFVGRVSSNPVQN